MRLAALAAVALAGMAAVADEPRVACPGRHTVAGIDVSKFQDDVAWPRVRKAGVRFVFVRVSDGSDSPDPRFARHFAAARDAGLLRGAYQYFRAGQDPVAQAKLLVARVGRLRRGDLPPVLDVETLDGETPAVAVARMRKWLAVVARRLGRRPLVYSNASTWAALESPRLAGHALWIAHWDADCPSLPDGFPRWTFWQHASDGRVDGIGGPVDLDCFNGSLAELERLAGVRRRQTPRQRTRR